jgi:hypothetical protein
VFCYPVSEDNEIVIEIMGADGRYTPEDALWIGERIIRTAKSYLPNPGLQATAEEGPDDVREPSAAAPEPHRYQGDI